MTPTTQELTVTADDFAQITRAEQARFTPMAIELAVARRRAVQEAVNKLMTDNVDYGKIPGGSDVKSLRQPGADKLNNLFGLVPTFITTKEIEDWTGADHGGEPLFSYTVTCRLHRNDFLMGEGAGECNSWESKYRYRKAERTCPACGMAAIIKGKEEYGGGWVCFAKKGGCNAKFKIDDPAIREQVVGRIANPDIYDLKNTILKMAMKRAKIAATLNATSAHEFFTQDLEDIPQFGGGEREEGQQEPQQQRQATGNTPRPTAQQAQPQQRESSPEDKERARVLATMTDAKGITAAFAEITPRYLRYYDQSAYEQILSEHQMLPGQARTTKKARDCWIALDLEIRKAQRAEAADEPPIQDDPPPEMRG